MPLLTTATVTFNTTSNDKDDDTTVDVTLVNNRGQLLASSLGNTGHYNNNSTNTIELQIANQIDRAQVPAARILIMIHPNGNDRWDFNYNVTLGWSDGAQDLATFNGCSLTQDNSVLANHMNIASNAGSRFPEPQQRRQAAQQSSR